MSHFISFVRIPALALRQHIRPLAPMGVLDEDPLRLRVLPNDIDLNMHMNNARYLNLMDYARTHLLARTRLLDHILRSRPFLVSAGNCHHRPVGPEHQPLGTERRKDHIEIGLKIIRCPVTPFRLVCHAGDFAVHILAFGKLLHVLLPWRDDFVSDAGLRDVIDDKYLTGMPVNEGQRLRQMAVKDQDVVDESVFLQQADAAIEIVAEHVIRIGLVMQDMPHGFEAGITCIAFQTGIDIGAYERNPSDHAEDKRLASSLVEQKFRFFEHLASLHRNRAFDA